MLPRFLRYAPLAVACAASFSSLQAAEVEPGLRASAQQSGSVDTLIVLEAKAPKQLLRTDGDYLERRRNLVDILRATAEVTQAELRDWLDAQGIAYRPFWIVNMIEASLTPDQMDALAARSDVAKIESNRSFKLKRPDLGPEPDGQLDNANVDAPLGIEWGVDKVRAPMVWAAGFTGQGIVIAGQDTGIRWTHDAIKNKYRGWNGLSADHNYNWHDSVHGAGNATCPGDRLAPCDDHGHGSHTIGTMLGDDGGSNEVGVAPGAEWIGCRNMNAGAGTPASYNECAQFFLAPTNLAGTDPQPDLAPDVISNSWGCPIDEGCTAGTEVQAAIENLVDGGIVFVAAAGNDGSSCSTIFDAPATYDASFTIGSMTQSDTMSSFSSRGPVSALVGVKPDVIAPGSSVRSINRTSDSAYTTMSGTSMATPHVAGVVALIMSVNPSLRGNPARVEQILRDTAIPLTSTTQVCGGIPATTFPNPVQGTGRVDAWNAFLVAEKIFADGFDD
ncbi:MAG TPA: S8 family serine peptidase [Dokdonella sp.]|uniref:S8 family serine peptidase n=1 Tax=Dokdonella sp. TaxID=2291710 RepID=UPI002D7F3C18|nr:S8 family serine peptidase [Dokdonella sp.]HET9032001.1 S8 family serine peptidase [Dokdonella sp.]